MPYNYFQQKHIYDQMNGTAERERQQAEMAKKSPPAEPAKTRPSDSNQLAKAIVGIATGDDPTPAQAERKQPKKKPRPRG